MLEYFYDDSDKRAFIEIDSKVHLEHILPKEPNHHGWDKIFTQEEIKKYTNSLANLTLLRVKKNIGALNYDFNKKKDIYRGKDKTGVVTCYNITKELLDYEKWDMKGLKDRGDKLKKRINDKLDIFK